MQHCTRWISEVRTCAIISGLIVADALTSLSFISCGILGFCWYTIAFNVPHKKKSNGVVSAERGSHEVGLLSQCDRSPI